MHIREANKSDVEVIAKVIQTAYATVAKRFSLTVDSCPKHPSNCTIDWIEGDYSRGVQYFVLESGNIIIGCFAHETASGEMCYLERLAVLPDRRKQGAGHMLVDFFLQRAARMGFNKAGVGIIAKQDELKNWYKKIGFVETGRKQFSHLPFEVAFMEYQFHDADGSPPLSARKEKENNRKRPE